MTARVEPQSPTLQTPKGQGGLRNVVLAAVDLEKHYDLGGTRVAALNKVSLEVQQGSFLAVMGPSGSGKSTLLNLLGLLDSPDAGRIEIGGRDTAGLNDDTLTRLRRDQIGFIFQSFELIPTLSVRENILLPSELAGRRKEAEARLPQLLERLGLEARLSSNPTQLSGGQRQRVAIARALVHQPLLVLADEPTGNLDSKNGREVLNIFRRGVTELGLTVVMVTHDPLAALEADQIVFLRDGVVAGQVLTHSSEARKRIEEFVGV